MGITPYAVPIRPTLDFGINIPTTAHTPPKAISAEEANKMFGVSLAVKMNFIPQMLIALALDYATQFVNHCRENRIREFKKHNRLIKVEEDIDLAIGYADLRRGHTAAETARINRANEITEALKNLIDVLEKGDNNETD